MNFESKLKELNVQAFYKETDKNGNTVEYQKISEAGSGIYMLTKFDDRPIKNTIKQELSKFLEVPKTIEAIKKVRTKFRSAYKAPVETPSPAAPEAPV